MRRSNGAASGGGRNAYINGKFLTAPPTGVQRVARELLFALDETLSEQGRDNATNWTLLTPRSAEPLKLRTISQVAIGRSAGVVWEQGELPFAANDGVLVNFCNVAPLLHKNNIVTIHDAQVYQSKESYSPAFRHWYTFLQPKIARRARALVTVSNFSKEEIQRFGVTNGGKIFVIPNGVDHIARCAPSSDVLQRNGLSLGRFFLAFSSMQAHKNMDMLIDAFSEADAEPFKLALIGGEAGATQYGGRIVCLGSVTDSELNALYANAVFFLFPSKTEGFGLPPGEALACGCPAIVSSAGALAEYYRDAAIMLDPTDQGAWREMLETIARQPDLRTKWAKRGAALPEKLTWRAAAEAYVRVINEVR